MVPRSAEVVAAVIREARFAVLCVTAFSLLAVLFLFDIEKDRCLAVGRSREKTEEEEIEVGMLVLPEQVLVQVMELVG